MKFKQLTYADRLTIEKMYNRKKKYSYAEIANIIGCTKQTIYNEIKRGSYMHRNTDLTETKKYSADLAQRDRDYKQTSKGSSVKLTWNMVDVCKEYIIGKRWSPRLLCPYLKSCGIEFVSYTTLYRYIDLGYIPDVTRSLLPYPKRKRKYRKVAKRASAGLSIEKRSPEVLLRSTFGHWEMDSVVGKRSGVGESLLVLTERKTRFEIIAKLHDKSAKSVTDTLGKLVARYGRIFDTITVDNGSEFSDYAGIKRHCNEVYYCHPYSSYERGSNENANRMIRRHFPKGISFKGIDPAEISEVQNWMNNLPRKILNYRSPKECFDVEMALRQKYFTLSKISS